MAGVPGAAAGAAVRAHGPVLSPGAEVGIDALELFVEVLSQSDGSETLGAASGDGFYDRLCDAVCRLARMRRAVIFRYDSAVRRVRAAGAHGLNLEQFANAYVTVESAPIAAQSLREDRVIEIVGDMTGQFPEEYASIFPEPVRLVCAPMAAAGRAMGVIFADRLLTEPPLDDSERHLLWTLGKAAALASVARIVAKQAEEAQQLEQRIDLARDIHEVVIQRLFGVSMALDGDGDLPAEARQRCATRDAGGALGSAHRAPASARPESAGDADDVRGRGRAARAGAPGPGGDARGRWGGGRAAGARAAGPVGARRGCPQRAQARQPQSRERPDRARRRRVRARGGQRRASAADGSAPGWGCGWPRSRRCRAAASSNSASASPAPGRFG